MLLLLFMFESFLMSGGLLAWAPGQPPAEEVASRLVPAVLEAMHQSNWFHFRNFGTWSYEGGAITRGLWEISHQLGDIQLESFLHDHLNFFIEDPDEFGYRILHNESLTYNDTSILLPWIYSIGDNIGLFPVVYADRLRYATVRDSFNPDEDSYILSEVTSKYIYGYPWHLPDGTISRPLTWLNEGFIEPHGTAVWVDDTWMGTAVLVAWARQSGDVEHLRYAANQVQKMIDYLYQQGEDGDGLLHHGFNFWTTHMSCCKWARGNGWAFLAVTEVLELAEEMDSDLVNDLLLLYQRHALGLLAVQSNEGLWHNILTNNSTFLETSSSAMFLTGLARGLRHNWFDNAGVDSAIVEIAVTHAWSAVTSHVMSDGTIEGIIGGTGIQNQESDYAPDSTDWNTASPGVGGVLRAVAEIAKLQQKYQLTNN